MAQEERIQEDLDPRNLWTVAGIGCRQNKDDNPPCKSGTAKRTWTSEKRKSQRWTENPEGRYVQDETQEGPRDKIGREDPDTRRPLCLTIENISEENDRKVFKPEVMKRAVGMSSGLQRFKDWTLWRGRPPRKRKKRRHTEQELVM
jgi:hypothetical protein